MFSDWIFWGITGFLFFWFFAAIVAAYYGRKELIERSISMYGQRTDGQTNMNYYQQRDYNEAYEQCVTPPAILLLIWAFAILEALSA